MDHGQDEIIAWVAAQEDGTNAGFVFGVLTWALPSHSDVPRSRGHRWLLPSELRLPEPRGED